MTSTRSPALNEASFADLSAATLYDILRLRAEVFVVEQDCVYLDPDGRDREPGARHLWIQDGGRLLACLRLLSEPEGTRIGRVATAPEARGHGLAGRLIEHALGSSPGPWVLSGQCQLEGWYEGFGFERQGASYLEDGIPHVAMLRPRPVPNPTGGTA